MGHAINAGARTSEDSVGSIRWLTWWFVKIIIIVGGLICLIDAVAFATRDAVAARDGGWWGASEISSQANPGTGVLNLRVASLRLFVTISGDQLAAHYRIKTSSSGALVQQALAAQRRENGSPLVDSLLGQVSVAQFHYGLTGSNHVWLTLRFGPPLLQVNGNVAIVTISSVPLRLPLDQQLIAVSKPRDMVSAAMDSVQVRGKSSAIQVLNVSGARLLLAQRQKDVLRRSSSAAIVALLREPGQTWTTGLRAMGGRTIPLFGGLMLRLGSIFVFIVLLWSLAMAGRKLPDNPVIAVGRNAVAVIVGGFSALAVLNLSYQIIFDLAKDNMLQFSALAGPVGLLIGGVLVLWPLACWRIKPDGETTLPGIRRGVTTRPWLKLSALMLIALAYLIALHPLLGISPFDSWQIIPSVTGIAVLIYLLVNMILARYDRKDNTPFYALAIMLAAVLASTVLWPIAVYSGFGFGVNHEPQVNVLGKWTFLVAAAITVLGLCVLTLRFVGTASRYLTQEYAAAGAQIEIAPSARKARRLWRVSGLAIAAVALIATLPPLVAQAQVGNPHAPGLIPVTIMFYSGFYRALPELLNWLVLGLAITALLSIARTPKNSIDSAGRPAAVRSIAIPVMMLLLYTVYSGYTWLYIPVTSIGGLMILTWLVLPKSLLSARRTHKPAAAIQSTLDAWRNAEFADGQRQKLLGNADDLRAVLIKDGTPAYNRTLDALTRAQAQLAARRDRWQREAHARLKEAFDHRGELPSRRIASRGAIVGMLLGLIPAAVLLLSARPVPGWSGFPILDFLGYTAWILFIWPALGWSIGYFLPYIRGRNGIEKALWIFAAAAAPLPMSLLWFDGHEWVTAALTYYLELFSFLLVAVVILCDLMALKSAKLPFTAWIQVHNWRFLVTWSTALIAAIGTATLTFLTTTATDLSQQTVSVITGQSSAQNILPHK